MALNNRIPWSAIAFALCLAFSGQALAANNSSESGGKKVNKGDCELAGGTYSEGVNFTRCEWPDGDSYTCNSDVNQCESCINGKCTVELRPGGKPSIMNRPLQMKPQTTPPPGKPPVQQAPAKNMRQMQTR